MAKTLRNCAIIGTGAYLPEKIVPNSHFEAIGSSDEWIQTRLGIKERHWAHKGQPTSDLALKASRKALADAGMTAEDVDLIVLATTSPDRRLPSTACILQDKLQAHNAAAFDVAAACCGFVLAMNIASQYIASGAADNVLVIGADEYSTLCDPGQRDTIVFFGDGAGAVVMSPCHEGEGILASNIFSHGDSDHIEIPAGGSRQPLTHEGLDDHLQYLQMDAKETFRVATSVLPEAIRKLLAEVDMTIDDVDYVIPHQPGEGMLHKITDAAGIPWEKVQHNMDKYANTSAATVPIMLDETYRSGKLKKGDIVVSVAIGAGWVWGATIYRWVKQQYSDTDA